MTWNMHGRSVGFILISALLALQPAIAGQADVGMRVMVLAGSGTQNIVSQRAANPLTVRVVDRENRPLSGATVVFTAPTTGPSGDFLNETNSIIVFTNSQGLAVAEQYRANSTAGAYEIQIQAAYMGEIANAAIRQTNIAPKKSGGKMLLIIAAAGGAAAAAVMAKGKDGGQTGSSPPPPVVTPTTIGFAGTSVGAPPR